MTYDPQQWRDYDPTTPVSGPRMAYAEAGIKGAHDAIAGHQASQDPHTQYLTQARGDARYPSKADLVVNVKDYGAKGDGASDDNAAIHSARDAAGAGGRLYFPPGTYRVSGLLANVAGQTWELHPNAILKSVASATASVIDIRAGGVTITGGTVDGNRPNVPSSNVVGIFSGSVIAGTTIQNVRVQSCSGYGIWLLDNTSYRIHDCTVTGTALTGIIAHTSTVNISDGSIRNNTVDQSGENPATITSHGMTARGGGGFQQTRLTMHGNHVVMPQAPTDTQNRPICIEAQVTDSSIVGNTTLYGAMGISLTGCSRVTVTANSIFGPTSSAVQQYGIEIAGSPNCTITGNTIEGLNALTDGIGFSQSGSTDCTVSGNAIRQTTIQAIGVSGGCSRPVITGNNISITTGSGIRVANGSNDSTIVGNVINGNASGGAIEGIRIWSLSTAVAGVLVSGNRIMGFPKGVAIVGAAALVTDRLVVVGNDFTGCTTPWSETYTAGATLGMNVRIRSNVALTDLTARRPQTLASDGAVSIDASTGDDFSITLQANATSSSITNPTVGQRITVTWVQDATGGRTYVWPTNCKFAGGAAPSDTAAGKRSSVDFIYDGTNWNEKARAVAVG